MEDVNYYLEDALYEHDCDRCEYLGKYESVALGLVDLYFHKRDEVITSDIIIRFGNDGPDYISTNLAMMFAYPIGSHRREYTEIITRYLIGQEDD